MLDKKLPIEPPVGDPKRSAWEKLRGYRYQIWHGILRWINLQPEQDLFLETAEDVDLASPDKVEAEQLKNTTASLSLNTAGAMKALRDFWEVKRLNKGRQVIFNYITTGDMSKEEKSPFTKDRYGLHVWESAKTLDADVEEIRGFLLERGLKVNEDKKQALPDEIIEFLKTATVDQLRDELIVPITWQPNAPTLEEINKQVEDAIFAYSFHHRDPFRQEWIEALKNDLLEEAFRVATSKLDRRLTARLFADLFRKHTFFTAPRSMRPPEAEVSAEPATTPAPAPVLPIDWKVPSSDLEDWPTSVGENRELDRPELETIKKAIAETDHSAHLILGEAGSGKSAFLATLTRHLSEKKIPYLALKADLIGANVENLESLVPGLIGQSLAVAVGNEANNGKFVVLVDQLDAVCSLTDKKTRRLSLILHFLRKIGGMHNVHIVSSCRPFELATDLRLEKLRATKLQLELPSWEKVEALLRAEGVNLNQFTDTNREVLRVPWNLKLFLALPEPRPLVDSFYALAAKVWEKAVKDAENSSRCLDLADLVAQKIDELEDFWIPASLTDGHVPERMRLLAESILRQPAQPTLIGFRHQTLYDYFLLGIFQRRQVPIEQYLQDHKQSFFIRPIVTRTLTELRATNLPVYHQALRNLMTEGHLRRHLKYLLLEFVGKQVAPTQDEIALFLPMLDDEKLGQQFLQATKGSRGWFAAVRDSSFPETWMKSKDRTGFASTFLGAAIAADEEDVVSLVTCNWFGVAEFNHFAIWVLSQTREWGDRAVNLLEEYAKQVRFEDAVFALQPLIRKSPAKATKIVGHLYRNKADAVLVEIAAIRSAPTSEPAVETEPATTESLAQRLFEKDPIEQKVEAVLAEDLFHHSGISQVATKDPLGFLNETWPKTKELLALTQDHRTEPQIEYEHDRIDLNHRPHSDRTETVIDATEKALEQLARTAPEQFQAWANAEKAGVSMTVHRLIACGAIELDPAAADWVVSYLIADDRRLYLGDFQDDSEDTRPLLTKFAPTCSPELLAKLTAQIVGMPERLLPIARRLYERSDDEANLGSLRRDRAQLLAAFPQIQMAEEAKDALAADVEQFGQPRRRRMSQGGFVGPPVKAEEFEGKTEDEVFAVLDAYPDDYVRANQWDFDRDVSRSGGVEQQAEAFAVFALTHVDMGRALLARFKPRRHEKYVSAILRKWTEQAQQATRTGQQPANPPGEIEQTVLRLITGGFASIDFRISAAHVLQIEAQLNKGLQPETLAILKSWLPDMPVPKPEDSKPPDGKDVKDSYLYSAHGGWLCPTGRADIVEAIIAGLLYQNPAKIDETLTFLEELLDTEPHPAVWAEALRLLAWLFGKIPERITAFVDKLFARYPEVLAYYQTGYVLADIAGEVDPTEVEAGWIQRLRERDQPLWHLIAGELTILHFVRKKTPWAKGLVETAVNGQQDEEFFRGVTYGAASFIGHTPMAAELATILLKALASSSEKVRSAALTVLHHIDEKSWSPSAKRVLDKIIGPDLSKQKSPEIILNQVESIALVDPEYALGVAEAYVKEMAKDPQKTNSWRWGASPLTNIALEALRTDTTRERGLTLFEDLLDMHVHEAKQAANLMNHIEKKG